MDLDKIESENIEINVTDVTPTTTHPTPQYILLTNAQIQNTIANAISHNVLTNTLASALVNNIPSSISTQNHVLANSHIPQVPENHLAFDPCLVCGQKTKGLHFQVSSCRACAAFFRRATKTKQIFRCQRGTKNCDLTNKMKGRPLCRYCRLKKCKEIGMKLEHDEEAQHENPPPSVVSVASTTATASVPTFSPANMATPVSLASPAPSSMGQSRIEAKKLTYNALPIIQAIKTIFNQPPKSSHLTYGVRLNFVQQLQVAFSKFLEVMYANYNGTVEIIQEFDTESVMIYQEKYFMESAKMLMACDQFAELPANDKYLLYKRFWQVFQSIERTYSTCLFLGHSTSDYRMMINDKQAMDLRSQDYSVKGIAPEAMAQMKSYFEPMAEKAVKFYLIPVKAMQLKQFEIIYLIGTVLWTIYDIKGRLAESTMKIAEEMADQCANELHNFYVYELRMTNYAARLSKLNKMIPIIEDMLRQKRELNLISKVFNFFDVDFSDSNDLIEIC